MALGSSDKSIAAVHNRVKHKGVAERARTQRLTFLNRSIGSRFMDAADLDAASPERHAARVRAPVLLIHSKDDTVVPIGQSMIMRDALETAGKRHAFIRLDGEDHWLSTGATRTEMPAESLRFIEQHIGGD
ncbi:MAG: prolyl oligopeptidase family serine peptidase [Pseudomonadota bacterium]